MCGNMYTIKAYLPLFLLPSISCPAIKKKIIKHLKRGTNKQKVEDTEQVSEPYIAGMLELLDQKFKTAMINMLPGSNG